MRQPVISSLRSTTHPGCRAPTPTGVRGRARTAAAAAPAWRVARARGGPAATHVCPRPRLAPRSPSPAAAPPAPVRRRLRHSMHGTGAKFMHREKVTSCVQRSAPRPGPASCRVRSVPMFGLLVHAKCVARKTWSAPIVCKSRTPAGPRATVNKHALIGSLPLVPI